MQFFNNNLNNRWLFPILAKSSVKLTTKDALSRFKINPVLRMQSLPSRPINQRYVTLACQYAVLKVTPVSRNMPKDSRSHGRYNHMRSAPKIKCKRSYVCRKT